MVKLRAKNLLALALSILMLTGTVSDWLPTALAVAEPSAVTEQVTEPETAAAEPETAVGDDEGGAQLLADEGHPARMDFQDPDNGRPNLYVDFLGDNIGNGPNKINTPGNLVAPADYNKDKRTNPIAINTWGGYNSTTVGAAGEDKIIFWIGVGIDRTQVWELLKNGGLTSLEVAFYYNDTYIAPYVEKDSTFAATITKANIKSPSNSYPNRWDENYRIIQAETGLPVEEPDENILRADPITQDELESPSLDNIRNNTNWGGLTGTSDWKMTYISLELENLDDLNRRLNTDYDQDAVDNQVVPDAASGIDNPPVYLMMIPFVVHRYDANERLCLRLVRDASHFSISAGNDGKGDVAGGSYAAWERVTTRNEGKDLKLQLRFAGDLNIWNVDTARVVDKTYTATLLIQNGGGSQNTARLSVQGDPGATPVYVDKRLEFIQGLQGGTGMEVSITVQTGYKAIVWVFNQNGGEELGWPFVTVTEQEYYTFVMPNQDTFVRVIFQPDNTRDFTVYLSEIPKPNTSDYMLGNETTVSSRYNQTPADKTDQPDDWTDVSINSFDPPQSHPDDGHGEGPKMKVSTKPVKTDKEEEDTKVTVDVSTHPDYVARVYVYSFDTQKNLEISDIPVGADRKPDADGRRTIIDLPYGGAISFLMPQSDVDVVVEYVPADTSRATLEVHYTNEASSVVLPGEEVNIAQLAYLYYDNEAAVSTAYSGQVYELVDKSDPENMGKRDHSKVKEHSYKTGWVPYSAATVSNSLGGDTGRTGRSWSDGAASLMATLANATSESNLAGRFSGTNSGTKTAVLDLWRADLLGDGSYLSLRKNLDGEPYGDGDLNSAAALLWELRSKILADTTPTTGLKALYYAEKTVDGTTYNYFALTPAQVQAYRIACLEIDAIYRANQKEYRAVYQRYQQLKQIHSQVAAVENTKDATPPILPLAPQTTQVTVDATMVTVAAKDLLFKGAQATTNDAGETVYNAVVRYSVNGATVTTVVRDGAGNAMVYDTSADAEAAANSLVTVNAAGTPDKQTYTIRRAPGLREYQDEKYISEYIRDYKTYLDGYETFITALRDGTGDSSDTSYSGKPSDLPVMEVVKLLTDTSTPATEGAPAQDGEATAAVKAAIQKYGWDPKTEVKDPSASIETTASSAVSTRSGRTVWLLLEADSAYELDHVELWDEKGNRELTDAYGTVIEAKASTSFKNVYTFSMPEENCLIRVFYRLRGQRILQWQVINGRKEPENVAHIEAYQVTTKSALANPDTTWGNVYPDSITKPTLAKRTNADHVSEDPYPAEADKDKAEYTVGHMVYAEDDVDQEHGVVEEGVLVGSQVTIRVTCAKGYEIRDIAAYNGPGGDRIPIDRSNAAAGIYTFIVPEGKDPKVDLKIEYAKENLKTNNAHIRIIHGDGSFSNGNTGIWTLSRSRETQAEEGTELDGEITLAEGYYIYTAYSVVASGSQPFTLDGNGYNNSLGAGAGSKGGRSTVKLETVMPAEELWIYIVVRKGLPPDEPGNALTVVVVDQDNTGTPPADNWAKATVYKRDDPDQVRAALDTVSVKTAFTAEEGAAKVPVHRVTHDGRTGNPILTGDRVELDLSAASGYYVAEVALAPSYLGGDLEWLAVPGIDVNKNGTRKLQFTMPAGSTTVTVRFRKLEGNLPSYYVYAQKIETDRNGNMLLKDEEINKNNKITSATSETIRRYTGGGSLPLTEPNQTRPEQVPKSETGTGAGVAGETVTMTFQVDKGWYVQSVAVMTDGSARPLEYNVTSGDNNGGGGTFTADLVMPSGDASFIVKYRQCPENLPRPEIPEYAITLMVIDDDNTGDPPDPNTVTAAFVGDEGFTHSAIHAGGNYDAAAIQYIHAGDRVRLSYDLAPGYTLDYMIVNPTEQGIVPTYLDTKTAQFTMPARNITVIAKIVKREQQQYIADLILHPPTGMAVSDLEDVGWGTLIDLDNDTGYRLRQSNKNLADYQRKAIYSLLLDPGKQVDFDLYAFDGYYIRAVTVEPAVGADPSLTGSYGYQSGSFVMPAANVYVNVYFEKLWPDKVKFDLTLKVHDASTRENNYAYFATVGGVDLPAADQKHVHGGETHTVRQAALDGQEVYVALNRETGYYYDPASIRVTDSSGEEISWRMTSWPVAGTNTFATGIAFLMPPRSTTVEITFRKDNRTPEENPPRRAILHINGAVRGDETLSLYRTTAAPGYTSASANSEYVDNLYAGDLVYLDIGIPDASKAARRVAAAYAVDGATGDQLMLPITQVSEGGLNSFPVPTLPAGLSASADKDIHVYVTLEDKAEGDVDLTMSLVVQGPSGSGTATLFETEKTTNSVTAGALGMYLPDSTTETYPPAGSIHAKQGNALTVTMEPANGYYISQLTVTDASGAKVDYDWITMVENDMVDPAVWERNEKQQITLLMPAVNGTVQVTYAKLPVDDTDPDNPKPKTYTAQVVVNDDEYDGTEASKNDAFLSVATDADGKLILDKLVTAAAGQWVDLDITVQTGYRIEPIFVSPQSFGIKPQLYLGDLESQTTGFYMPAGDVTVYVRFVRDDLPIYNATLEVKGYQGKTVDSDGLGSNNAKIYSDRTNWRGPIDSTDYPVFVQAAANREWVTVKYYWDDQSWVSSVTVKDWAGRNVPFTQVDENTITLPMVARDIIITVTYEDKTVTPPPVPPGPDDPDPDPTPELTPVRLHVIDMTNGSITTTDQGWGRVTHNGTNADVIEPGVPGKWDDITFTGYNSNGIFQQTVKLPALPITAGQTDAEWGNTRTIWVPAGRTVTLEAFSDVTQGIYIHSAYVLYRDGGQMISCNLQPNNKDDADAHVGFYNYRTADFQAHPDYNDVYVYLTTTEPTVNEYAATLMLKSPEGDIGSVASISTGGDLETTTNKASVKANGDHARILAKRKDTVTVTVTPAAGYAIDYILMTPLGVPITPKRGEGNTYTFTMPAYNVCACVYLKRSSERKFYVTVHYEERMKDPTDLPGEHNRATVSWDPDDGSGVVSRTATRLEKDSTSMQVAENATVTLDVTLDDPYVVLAAYALQGGAIVPMAPALEGTKETRSMTDNSLPDGEATFTMPGGNVDVYVVTTNDPPTGEWHTAVLTVEDPDTWKEGNPGGISRGSITRDNTIDNTVNDLPRPRTQMVTSARPNHKFVSVREGQTVSVVVYENNTYTFDQPALLTHAGSYSATLTAVSSSATQHEYEFIVGKCNSAVLARFKAKDAKTNDLTVVVEDPDNPGNTSVRQVTTVTAGTKPALSLVSESYLGAYQVIPDVEDGSAVTLRAEAYRDNDGNTYQAYAYWSYDDGNGHHLERISLTQTGNVYTGSVTMPGYPATITVTYYKTYKASIIIHDRNLADQSSSAQMEASVLAETDFPPTEDPLHYNSLGHVTVNQSILQKDTIYNLDTGTLLTTTVSYADGSDVSAVLATDASGTHFLDPEEDTGEYLWTVDKSNVDIVVMVDAVNTDTHIASVVTLGKPASAGAPTIAVNPVPTPDRNGVIWTSADAGNPVTVTVPSVDGYRVTVTAKNMATKVVTTVPAAGNTYVQTMPNANLQFTVTYVKEPTLTLRVLEPASTAGQNATRVTGGAVDLTENGETTTAVKDDQITVTATPSGTPVPVVDALNVTHNCPVVVKEIAYRTPTNTTVLYTNSGSDTDPVTRKFTMPDADVTVVVRYGLKLPDGVTPNTPDEEDYYTAWVETAGDDNQPENRVNFIQNVSVPANTYPTGTPDWACGAQNNEMKLSISVKDKYYVTVTAETRNPDGTQKAPVPVILQGDTGLCSASVTMPGEDVFITVTYKKIEEKPEPEPTNVTLVLVGHGGLLGNSATVTGLGLTGLSANGQTVDHLGDGDRVYAISGTAKEGDELRLSANWTGKYKITRATLSLPKTAGAAPDTTDELLPDGGNYVSTTLDLSRYGTNATARLKLPAKGAVITVYYDSIFEATFHVARNGTTGDTTHATDDRAKTETSTGTDPIFNTGDKLISMTGGEQVQTTAIPNDTNGQRLVGVVWECATKGAAAADSPTDPTGLYTFTMQEENVDFYAVYEPKSDNPSYIAKVRFGDKSAHQGDSGNAVTITNSSDSTASHGTYWTAAKQNDTVTVNVKVAEGYKAKITSTVKDHITPHADDGYDFYISRLNFVPTPTLTLGKDAVFTMPANTDATVEITFIKGYDLALEVSDTSRITSGLNQADVNIGALHGESDGTNITYTPAAAVETDSSGTKRVVTHGVADGTTVTTTVTPASNDVPYKVYQSSLFSGTERVDKLTGTPLTQPPSPYDYTMPSADVLETVLFYNNETPLLAKVEVKGESDINGNSATPIIDRTDTASATPKTTSGTVWTTTAGGNTIQLRITVAKGYVAKIKVRRDNQRYYENINDESQWQWLYASKTESKFQQGITAWDEEVTPAAATYKETFFTETLNVDEVVMGFQDYPQPRSFKDNIGGEEFFIFEMPTKDADGVSDPTDVTVIVEFEFAGSMPRPFNPGPDNMEMEKIDLDRGFIYGENRGDFALIDIPTLYQDSNRELFNTDNYDKPTTGDKASQAEVKFNFFLYNADRDEYTPLTLGVDVLLEPEDEKTLWQTTDPYNYYDYETTLAGDDDILDDDTTRTKAQPYVGSRFKLVPTDADELTGNRTAGAQALYDMLNDRKLGSLEQYDGNKYRTRLYVMAEDAIGQRSAYTQVWIRPYFTISVQVISYAPNHTTTASLYKLMDQDAMDLATGYKDADGNEVSGVDRVEVKTKTDDQWTEWTQDFKHYRWNDTVKPYLSNYTAYEGQVLGAHKYYQTVEVMSSELLGPYAGDYDPDPAKNLLNNVVKPRADAGEFTYALTLEKPSCLTYTRVDLNLWKDVDTTAGTAPSYYNAATLTYTVSDFIYLITGDVDGDGFTKWQDYDTVYTYVWRNVPWNNTQTEPLESTDPNYAKWLLSTHNPDSMAYRCDLDGDGRLTAQDVSIVQTVFDYNRSVDDYLWTRKLPDDKTESVLPFGFGSEKGSYTALFAFRDPDDVFPVEPDEYWDSLVDPDTTEAPPLNTIYVDEDGNLWDYAVWLAVAVEPEEDELPSSNRDTGGGEHRRDDAVIEIPMGEEVTEWPGNVIALPTFDPGPVVDLPAFDPGVTVDLPSFDPEDPAQGLPQNTDNGPGEATAETPADITTEE